MSEWDRVGVSDGPVNNNNNKMDDSYVAVVGIIVVWSNEMSVFPFGAMGKNRGREMARVVVDG